MAAPLQAALQRGACLHQLQTPGQSVAAAAGQHHSPPAKRQPHRLLSRRMLARLRRRRRCRPRRPGALLQARVRPLGPACRAQQRPAPRWRAASGARPGGDPPLLPAREEAKRARGACCCWELRPAPGPPGAGAAQRPGGPPPCSKGLRVPLAPSRGFSVHFVDRGEGPHPRADREEESLVSSRARKHPLDGVCLARQ